MYFQHDNDKLDDEELLLFLPIHLHDGLPHFLYYSFNIFQLQDDECEVEFSFKKEDIFRLAAVLDLPEVLKCQNGIFIDTVEGLYILLR